MQVVDAPCAHCGAHDDELLWTGREHEYDNTTDDPFTFVRCRRCSVVRLNPRPDVSELGRIYPPNYYAYTLVSDDAGDAERLQLTDRMKRRMYQQRMVEVVGRLGDGPVRILDVGCGDGRLLSWWRDSAVGARLQTHGIEMSEAAAEIAKRRGHDVIVGRFEIDEQFQPGTFDLIIASHVIEHVDDPKRFAERAAELLAPGGLFVIGTPNVDSVDARRLREHWGGNHFPRHWTLYDEGTLRALATEVGLEVDLVEYQPNPIFWVWTCHSWLRSRFPGRRWPDRLFPPVGIFRSTPLTFVLQSAFTVLDVILRRVTGRTASMSAELRKPR